MNKSSTKKAVSVIMCLVLVLLLGACQKKTDNDTTATYDPDAPATQKSGNKENTSDSNTATVTIPEGYTLVKISWLMEDNGVCSSADFISAAQSYDLSKYGILADVKNAQNVCFPLEGYLFPATYTFKKNSDPTAVIDKLVETFQSRFTDDMKAKAASMGRSVHEILTVASIIEKEAYTPEQRTLISSVLYNRLNAKMKLQCDVTVKYCTGVIELQYPDKIDEYKYYYNTYRCQGLPAGPICNPGIESINAALQPDNTDYLYFVINTEPPYDSAFSASYDEHIENCTRMGYTAK